MTTFTTELQPKLKLENIIQSPNVAKDLSKEQLAFIGTAAVEGYKVDRGSRSEWEQRNAKAIKLALQVQELKNFPWENCSNVKFPLLTIAALQFLARVSVLTKGRYPVKVETLGADPDGRKAARSKRVSKHMSLQLTDYDKNWVDNDEQAKMAASILGSAFKKTYPDSITGETLTEHVPAMNFVVDYYCKDIDKAGRATQLLPADSNYIHERVTRGIYLPLEAARDPRYNAPTTTPDPNVLKDAADEAEGTRAPAPSTDWAHTPDDLLEQHTWLDLDGDGYKEPYILIVHRETAQVLRIVARFYDEGDVHRVNDLEIRKLEQALDSLKNDPKAGAESMALQSKFEKQIDALERAAGNKIIRIDPTLHFTRYLFIPSPDGGVYGLGLGSLLSPLNESVNTIVNQLIDSGTMSNTAGGFLGRGVKLKGGRTSFDPFEWKPVESSGDDLRKNIFPLPVREPSTVLFQLLGMLVTYSEKVSGATDIMTGVAPGQNTPAETSRNTVEQGMMLFSGIYGRMYRSFREELRLRYNFNRVYLANSPRFVWLTEGPDAILAADDYTASTHVILPAASPEAVSITQRREKAKMLHALATSQAGFNVYAVTRDLLESWDYDNIDQYYPDPTGPNAIKPPVNPKVQLEQAKLQQAAKEHQDEMQLAIAELQSQAQVDQAKIIELQAKATKLMAEAQGVDTGHQIAMIDAQIGAAKAKQEGLMKALELLQRQTEHKDNMGAKAREGNKQPQDTAPNPQV